MPEYICRIGPYDTPSEVTAFDEEEAAEQFAKGTAVSEWPSDMEVSEWPSDMEVMVDGVAYLVTIEAMPVFAASKK